MPTQPQLYLGIDIGGTKIAAGIVTPDGRVLRKAERPTPASNGGAAVLAATIELATSLVSEEEPVTLAGIGIGAGGQIDADAGVVLSATDILPGWAGIRIKDAFTEWANSLPFREGQGVGVDNDVNALAMGELRFGAARGHKTSVFLALGTGLGGALLLDGKLHHGAHWTGAEFGHLILSMAPDARRDAGGARGTLEAYASGPGLVRTYREMSGEDDSAITGHDVADDALVDSGGIGAAAVARTGQYLGYGLASLCNALDPDIVVIGGGLASLGDLLLEPARRILREHALPGPGTCPVVVATLGADASIIGAAALAMVTD